MRKRLWAAMLAACVTLWGAAQAQELELIDVGELRELQALVASQRAEMNDLRAKMAANRAGALDGPTAPPENVISLRKNAVVTIGGEINTRYYFRDGSVSTRLDPNNPGVVLPGRAKREDMRYGDFAVTDAKLEGKIDVNEYFDAYFKLDFHDGVRRANVSGIAENYWVRWKNICNTGFGILVGRDKLKFGDDQPIGVLDSWNKDASGSFGDLFGNSGLNNWDNSGNGMFAYETPLPAHTTYHWNRTTQINPYWESADGNLRFDLSFLQSVDRLSGLTGVGGTTGIGQHTKYRSISYGPFSMTARVQWKPVDGLKLTASAMNLIANRRGDNFTWGPTGAINGGFYGAETQVAPSNSSVNLAVQYRPDFLPRLNLWAQWTHGWNEAWVRNMDSDSVNYGASWDLLENLTLFAQGDWLRTKNQQSDNWHRASGWAVYGGVVFLLPYGIDLEAGWRHEYIAYTGRTLGKHTKMRGNTVYMHLGFKF